jgi:hypothetical protein
MDDGIILDKIPPNKSVILGQELTGKTVGK